MRYHVWADDRESGCCGKRCKQCTQCKCEVGKRKFLCPGFNVHEHPTGFEHWKLDLEIDELNQSISYGKHDSARLRYLVKKLNELHDQKDALANGE